MGKCKQLIVPPSWGTDIAWPVGCTPAFGYFRGQQCAAIGPSFPATPACKIERVAYVLQYGENFDTSPVDKLRLYNTVGTSSQRSQRDGASSHVPAAALGGGEALLSFLV